VKKNHESNSQSTRAAAPTHPLFIGPLNATAMTGHSWRWCRDTARRLGVSVINVRGSSKSVIVAAELLDAIARDEQAHAATRPTAPPPAPGSDAEYAALLERAGLSPVRAA
jgi:hypothetical protein